jgi:hypothetical protein
VVGRYSRPTALGGYPQRVTGLAIGERGDFQVLMNNLHENRNGYRDCIKLTRIVDPRANIITNMDLITGCPTRRFAL